VSDQKINLFGQEVSVTEVPILERKEDPSQYKLGDGSVIRFVCSATSVLRINGQYDGEGNPIYLVKTGQAVTVVLSGSEVKKASNK